MAKAQTKKTPAAAPIPAPKEGDRVTVRALRNGPRVVDEPAVVTKVHKGTVDKETGASTPTLVDVDVFNPKTGEKLRTMEGLRLGSKERRANTWVPAPAVEKG